MIFNWHVFIILLIGTKLSEYICMSYYYNWNNWMQCNMHLASFYKLIIKNKTKRLAILITWFSEQNMHFI